MDDELRSPFEGLSRLARPLIDQPPVARTPMAELEHRARRRTGRQRATVALTMVVLVVGIGGLIARAGTPDASLDTQTGPTTTLPPRLQGDLVIYLEPDATADEIRMIRDDLVADPGVHGIQYESQHAAYAEFQCLFAAEPEMIESVTSAILPVSFRLYLGGDRATMDRIDASYGSPARPGVETVAHVPRGLSTEYTDYYERQSVPPTIDSDSTTLDPPSDENCPMFGERIK